ncbi:MAG TPA: MBG domain-containing protein [Candidatus Angelobacter sp.]|nr:MBG domain-containing protein [Candidatus Angelobacter sp.]
MRRTSLSTTLCVLSLLFLLQAVSLAQNPDPQPTPDPTATPQSAPPRNDDVDENKPAPPPGDAAPAPVQTIDGDSDSADLPSFAAGQVDGQLYLKMRDEHIRFLRGLMDKHFDPRARGQAIREMKDNERRMRESNGRGQGNSAGAEGAGTGTGSGAGGFSLSGPVSPGDLVPWTPLGPAPIPNGQTTSISTPVSGRVTAIAVHPTNENIVYVGTAQGGLYRSLDGGASWTPLMDDAQSLAIGSVAIDPLAPTTIFVGTGEGNLSGDSFFGVGLYIIKNAETTPTLLGPFNLDGNGTDVFTGRSITQVLVSPTDDNIVFVSTVSGIGGIGADSLPSVISSNLPSRGLYRSTNAMAVSPTFTKLTVQPANGGNRGVTDLAFDPADPNILLAGVAGFSTGGNDGGIWRSTNALAATPTFTNVQVVGTTTATIGIRFATNRVNGVTTVLAATGETSSVVAGSTCGAPGVLRRSINGGLTFNNGLPQAQAFCNTQCFYDMAPAMAPNDPNVIYLGGSANANTNPPRADCKAVVLSKATDGATLNRIDTGLHADTHAVTVAPSNPSVVYFGSDGGVWRSSNAGGSWQSLNNTGFNATQFQSVSVHPTDRNFSIGGTQDNGTPWLHPDTTWTRADFGDGGFALIDQNAPDTTNVTMYHTYFNQTNNLIGYARVTTTANAHDNGWGFFGCNGTTANNGFRCADAVLFYAPMALGPGSPNTLYFGTDRLYRSVNQGTNMTLVSQGPFAAGNPVSAIGVSRQNDNIRIVGLRNGRIFSTTTGANPLTEVTNAGMPVKFASRAVIDPNNSNTAYVTFAGFGILGKQIWKTTNLSGGSASWVQAASGLPNVPVSSFAIDPVNSQVLYAGTDIGVFISHDGGSNWNPYGTGLPRVAVFDMAIQNPNRVLRIATHGRGMWEIGAAKSPAIVTLTAPATATYGDNVTLAATVSAGGVLATPGGTVTFSDGGVPLGTTGLDAFLHASITTSTLSAGTHSIVATFNGDTVFDVSPSAPSSIILSPAPLTVKADNASRPFGQPNPVFTGSITGIKNGDNITATYSTTATPASGAGTYPIVPSLSDPDGKLGNYSVTSINGTLTITPAGLVITADNKTKLLNAPNPAFTASYNGFAPGDGPGSLSGTLTCTTTAVTNSPVGSYPITCSGQTSNNYTITYVPGTLSITFAPAGLVNGEPGHTVLPPVNANGGSVLNAGRTVPIKFRVGDVNGVSIGPPAVVVSSFRIIQVINGAGSSSVDLPVDSRTPDTSFRWDPTSQQWIFNLDTRGLAAGSTYVFRIALADGSHIDFQFGLR